jgi:hypothetical protein
VFNQFCFCFFFKGENWHFGNQKKKANATTLMQRGILLEKMTQILPDLDNRF